ncbi:peptidase family C78-domain-containing protein [Bisporella sp. PMI_857]|nr:peptidase family C78-domain-containing protein [Bisporella sp. PMI_857]
MEEEKMEPCPFCGYKADTEYHMLLHMEEKHSENGHSPFVVKEGNSSISVMYSYDGKDPEYVQCPQDGCGEHVYLGELESHVELHDAENDDSENVSLADSSDPTYAFGGIMGGRMSSGSKLSDSFKDLDDGERPLPKKPSTDRQVRRQTQSQPSDQQTKQKAGWKRIFNKPDTSSRKKTVSANADTTLKQLLGKNELGPYAHEKQMPSWLVKLLERDGTIETDYRKDRYGKIRLVQKCENRAEGILPVIRQLLDRDPSTEYAYLCHPSVQHIFKLKKEGGFCGYRNIQMLCSYIVGVKSQGFDSLENKIPTIFDIQEYVETAWDIGINPHCRVETGGIRGTRKYIGTPDAQTMCQSLGIASNAQAFSTNKDKKGSPHALEPLAHEVQNYFQDGTTDFTPKVRITSLPPMYLQIPGHSMTIIGFEKKRNGAWNFIVFDPMFSDSSGIIKSVGHTFTDPKTPAQLLRAMRLYRRGPAHLRRHHRFEILRYELPSLFDIELESGV